MKNSNEEIPQFILDIIGKKNFESLNQEEQNKVLQFFSKEEYNLINRSLSVINKQVISKNENRETIRQNLIDKFEQKHEKKANFFVLLGMAWKAAAILVLIGTGWFSHYLLNPKQELTASQIKEIDTVYLTQQIEMPPIRTVDTIFIERENQDNNGSTKSSISMATNTEINGAGNGYNDTKVISIKEENNKANRTKGNSIKDDSLRMKYNTVSL